MQATPTSQPKDVVSYTKLNRGGAEGARGAHNPEVTGSKPVPGIYHSRSLSELTPLSPHTATQPPLAHRKQRRAHNPEVTGSTPVGGIYHSLALQKLVV
jgi:hypothetical protein